MKFAQPWGSNSNCGVGNRKELTVFGTRTNSNEAIATQVRSTPFPPRFGSRCDSLPIRGDSTSYPLCRAKWSKASAPQDGLGSNSVRPLHSILERNSEAARQSTGRSQNETFSIAARQSQSRCRLVTLSSVPKSSTLQQPRR